MTEQMSVYILGTEYAIKYLDSNSEPKLRDNNGYCETYSKEIIISTIEDSPLNLKMIERFQNKVVRHEIIHAFLHESGLDSNSDWATNEEIIDWIAIQFPKMLKVFEEAKCM